MMFAIRRISALGTLNAGAPCIRSICRKNAPAMKSVVKYCTQINLNSESRKNDIEGGQNYSFNDRFQLTDIFPYFKRGELSPKFIHELLSRSLQCSTEEVENLCKTYPRLKDMPPNAFLNMVNYFHEQGIENQLLLENFWLFFQSFTAIKQKLDIISTIGEVEDSVLLVKFNLRYLKNICTGWNQSRLDFMKEKIGWNMKYLVQHPYFLTCDFDSFSEKVNLLLENGLRVEDLKESLSVYKLSAEHIRNRLKECERFNVGSLKCWMLTCPDDKFEKLLISWKDLGNELNNVYDTSTYLQQRLNCDAKYINLLSLRYPPLLNVPLQQMKLVLDFLYSVGYNSNHVCLNLRILKEDVELLKWRYSQFQSLNYRPSHVFYLMANEKEYEKFVSNLIKNNRSEHA